VVSGIRCFNAAGHLTAIISARAERSARNLRHIGFRNHMKNRLNACAESIKRCFPSAVVFGISLVKQYERCINRLFAAACKRKPNKEDSCLLHLKEKMHSLPEHHAVLAKRSPSVLPPTARRLLSITVGMNNWHKGW